MTKTERQRGYSITDILSDDHIDAEERVNDNELYQTILMTYNDFKSKGMIDPMIFERLVDVFGARDTANAIGKRANDRLSNE